MKRPWAEAGADEPPIPVPELLQVERDRLARGDLLYRIYLVVVLAGIYGSVLVQALRTAVVSPLETDGYVLVGSVALLAVTGAALGGVRFGRWAGPVPVSRPEVSILLPTRIDRRQLLLPRLRQSCLALVAIGAIGGLTTVVLVGLSYRVGAPAWYLVPGLAAATGLLATGTSAIAQSRPLQGGPHRWISLALLAASALIIVVASAGTAGDGPAFIDATGEGLALLGASIVGTNGPGAASVLLLTCTVGAIVLVGAGRASILRIHDEELIGRAGLHAGLAASARMGDLRAISATRDPTGRARRVRSVPYPRRPARAVAWRHATTLRAHPAPLVRCAAGWSAATALIALAPEGSRLAGILLRVALAAGALYVGASPLLEPLRREHDSPLAAELLPFGFASLSWMHIRAAAVPVTAIGYLSASVTLALAGGGIPIGLLVLGVPLAALTTVVVLADRVRQPSSLAELMTQMPIGVAPEALGAVLAISLVQPLIALLPIALPIGLAMAPPPFSEPAVLIAAAIVGLGLVGLRVAGLWLWLRRYEDALHDAELLSPTSSLTLGWDHLRHRLARATRRGEPGAPDPVDRPDASDTPNTPKAADMPDTPETPEASDAPTGPDDDPA